MPTLADLQARFAAALRGTGAPDDSVMESLVACIASDGLAPSSRVRVYRNNSRAMFEGALERTYPALLRQVGEERFRGLARDYRIDHPSRSGDLHWVGAAFPAWLESRVAGSDDAWLADLARLEWACEEALVAERLAPLVPQALAGVPSAELADTGLALQPCLRTVSSGYPVWSAWREAQAGQPGVPLDQVKGPQYVVVTCTDDGLLLHSIGSDLFRFVAALSAGAPLGQALEVAELPVGHMPAALRWLFAEGLVVDLRLPEAGAAESGRR